MWTVIYMAQSKESAEELRDVLQNEGILVKIRQVTKYYEDYDNNYEVLVPKAEVDEAHSVIIENGY